ncbi:MAG: hypothetical protein U9R41_04765 [Candidatus Marinimicrobia bacterium]|nr:hypothetical protein [Candidatus Neomarinimicrobiota bacterium]
MNEFHELLCPVCGEPLTEEGLNKKLVCPHCKTNLKQPKFINFLEYLITQGIVENLDFFDETLYGNDFMRYESNEFDDKEDVTDDNDKTKPGGFFDKNVMQIEEEYVKDIHDDADEDYSVFNPDEVIEEDVDEKSGE